jgi:uncharacterized Zn-binding protein involved in type VI secretion
MGKPAARITDQHVCPRTTGNTPHVGGPIVAGCPSVLIGGQPAARVGDKAVCVGPPDRVARGSRSVLIGGRPAARMGDATAHGGRIVTGFPTVLIGDSGGGGAAAVAGAAPSAAVAGKIERIEARQSLIADGRDRAAGMTGKERDQLLAAADRFERNIEDVERARLAEDVYRAPGDPGSPPPGWKRLSADPDSLPEELRDIVWDDPKTGYRAALYESEIDGSRVLAFRGTAEAQGWKNNLQQGLGYESQQYMRAADTAKVLKRVYGGDFELSGHSLGGGLAQTAAGATGQPATVFNAAGPHPDTLKRVGDLDRGDVDKLVEAYHVRGEALTGGQRPYVNLVTGTLGTAGRWALAPFRAVGMLFGGSAPKLKPVWVYDAVGTRHTLPAVNAQGESMSILKARPIKRHGMDMVVNGFEKQKSDDQAAIERATVR